MTAPLNRLQLLRGIRPVLHKSCGRCTSRRLRCFSTSSTAVDKLGLGGHKWARMDASQYAAVVQAALDNGITTLEAGQDGESALAEAYKQASFSGPVCMTARLGYRTLIGNNQDDESLPHDVTIEEHPVMNNDQEESTQQTAQVVHNLSKRYVQQCLDESRLVQLRQDTSDTISLIYMLHNPEVQGKELVMERMMDAFCGLEEGIANGQITSFGVCSNGLSLPEKHPLHLPFTTILEAAKRASETVHGSGKEAVSGLTTLQLPVNLLESSGFLVARNVQEHLAGNEESSVFPSGIDVFAMRPLTCYPSRGTGSEHAFNLLDYQLPVMGSNETTVWTHEMEGPPPSYGMALNAAMGQFDATHILEADQERELTMEERETLDGCKLLHSMLHDLDVGLENIQSFAAYEEELYTRVIPLIHDTFEELDDDSATILQQFFAAHGLAVRHAIAQRTRTLIKEGGKESPPYDIPDNMTLQEYALGFLLREESISKVVVGCEQPNHVIEAVNIAKSAASAG